MTPTIRQSLKALHNIQKEDVYTILEIPGFLFMTLHRDSGISEVVRYETITGGGWSDNSSSGDSGNSGGSSDDWN
jgi:hypothetical protein